MFHIKNIIITASVLIATSSLTVHAMGQAMFLDVSFCFPSYNVFGFDDGSITLCQNQHGIITSVGTLAGHHKSKITALTGIPSDDDLYIFSGAADGSIKCCRIGKDLKLVPVNIDDHRKHSKEIIKLFATQTDGFKYIVSYAKDNKIKLWRFSNDCFIGLHHESTLCLRFKDDKDVLSVSCNEYGLLDIKTKFGLINRCIYEHKFVDCIVIG